MPPDYDEKRIPAYKEQENVINDPWKHRSVNMKCATCMWFVFKEVIDKPSHLGRCRRHAPSMNGFVPVYGTDWCGDHRIDENKI